MHPELPPSSRIPMALRRVVERFAGVVCPPEIGEGTLLDETMHLFELHVAAMPSHLRLGVWAGFVAFDQAARVWPPARGRRFADLDRARAERFFVAFAHGGIGPQRKIAQLMKGLLTLAFYEVPEVKEALGYAPDAYIAQVARRRVETYAEDIARAEAAVVAKDEVRS